jgi:hypothetical protein
VLGFSPGLGANVPLSGMGETGKTGGTEIRPEIQLKSSENCNICRNRRVIKSFNVYVTRVFV